MLSNINVADYSSLLPQTLASSECGSKYRGFLKKRCSENMQQIYRRTPMPKCDFNKVACNFIEIKLRHGCSPVNLRHIFRTPFLNNTSGWLPLYSCILVPIFLICMRQIFINVFSVLFFDIEIATNNL